MLVTVFSDTPHARVRDMRAVALSALPTSRIRLNTERMSGYGAVTTFSYEIKG